MVGRVQKSIACAHYVAQANSGAADYPIAEVEPPEPVIGETCQEDSQAVQKAAREGDDPWSHAIEPEATEKSRDAQYKNTDRKCQCDFGNTPAELLREWQAENTPRVHGAQGNLQKETRRGNTPSIRHNFSNFHGMLSVEESDPLISEGGVQRLARSQRLQTDRGDYLC